MNRMPVCVKRDIKIEKALMTEADLALCVLAGSVSEAEGGCTNSSKYTP